MRAAADASQRAMNAAMVALAEQECTVMRYQRALDGTLAACARLDAEPEGDWLTRLAARDSSDWLEPEGDCGAVVPGTAAAVAGLLSGVSRSCCAGGSAGCVVGGSAGGCSADGTDSSYASAVRRVGSPRSILSRYFCRCLGGGGAEVSGVR